MVDHDCLWGLDAFGLYTYLFWIEVVIEIRSLEVELDISLSRLLCHLCLFSNGMPVFHKRCQSQYHWVLSATLHKKKHDHRMTWLWHDTCSFSINKSHLLIRSRWLRNQNMLSMDQVLRASTILQETSVKLSNHPVVLWLFQKKTCGKTSSSCHRFCLWLSQALPTGRVENHQARWKIWLKQQIFQIKLFLGFLCYWSHFDIFWSTDYFKCTHLCTHTRP